MEDDWVKLVIQNLLGALGVRAVGHTYTMLHGVKNVEKCAVIVSNNSQLNNIKRESETATVVTLGNLERLKGSRLPVVIDNFALSHLLYYTMKYILKLERENDRLQK